MHYKKIINIMTLSVISPFVTAQVATLDKAVVQGEDEAPGFNQTIIDSNEIDTKLMSNITDSVRRIAGVQVNDTGDRFNDNGFNIRGMEGDAIAITVDGVSQGETLSPPSFAPYGMFGSNRNGVELETVKAIEIVKGPNSIITGSGALAGSVAYTTKDVSDFLDDDETFGGRLKAGFDSRSDETLLSAAIANRSGKLDSLIIYTLRDGSETESHDSGDDIVGSERGIADPYDKESDSILIKLAYNISDSQRFGVVYDKLENDTSGSPVSRDSGSYFDFNTTDAMNRERVGIFYDLSAEFALFDTLSASLDHQETFSSGETAFSYYSTRIPNDILRIEDRSFLQESLNLAVDFEKSVSLPNTTHNVVYGLDYQKTEVENELFDRRHTTTDPASALTQNVTDSSWVPQTDKHALSLYVLDRMGITDQLSVNAGLRYDHTKYDPKVSDSFTDPLGTSVDNADFSALVGQISFRYEFVPAHSFSVSYGQGYKAPTTQELYLGTNSGGIDGLVDAITGATFDDWDSVTNPNLEAEESNNVELSYQWVGEKGSLTLTAFNTNYENMIQSVSLSRALGQTIEIAPVCGRFGCSAAETTDVDVYNQVQNAGKVNVDGIELEAEYMLNDNLLLSFSYSTADGEHRSSLAGSHDKGDELATVSPDSAVLGLHYNDDQDKWGVSSYVSWVDQKDESTDLSLSSLNNGSGPALFSDSYTVLDISAFYNISEQLSVTAAINNVTDKDYIRWEVINSVRTGTGGFFSGASGNGVDRFSNPGRNASINVSYKF